MVGLAVSRCPCDKERSDGLLVALDGLGWVGVGCPWLWMVFLKQVDALIKAKEGPDF